MSSVDDIKARVDKLANHMYKELYKLIQGECNCSPKSNDILLVHSLQKYKPSKHKKAYKVSKNLRKRCYVR